MLKGLTLPNRQWDPYTPAELAALEDLQPRCLVWILYGGQIDTVHSQQLAPFIRAHVPRILYRPYRDDIAKWAPADWAKECFNRINALGIAVVECIPANELNLEGMGEDWQRQITWLKAFAVAWRALSSRLLHLPALSPSGNWTDGLVAYRKSGVDQLYDRVDAHCYGDQAATIAMAVASTLRGLIDVTEFNQVDPGIFLNQGEKGIESATWFLLGGTEDQAQYDILKQPTYYQSFKEWKSMPNPTTPTFNVGQGVKDLMATQHDHPVSNEHYLQDTNGVTFMSITKGTKGEYHYDFESNGTVFFPFP